MFWTCRLSNPDLVVTRLSGMKQIYEQVVGKPPDVRMMTAARSSYIRNTPETFEGKLEKLVER